MGETLVITKILALRVAVAIIKAVVGALIIALKATVRAKAHQAVTILGANGKTSQKTSFSAALLDIGCLISVSASVIANHLNWSLLWVYGDS